MFFFLFKCTNSFCITKNLKKNLIIKRIISIICLLVFYEHQSFVDENLLINQLKDSHLVVQFLFVFYEIQINMFDSLELIVQSKQTNSYRNQI
jgi:hypothetical protein